MRGQWISYDSFNLIDLIDEVKTRIKEPFRVDNTIHGAMIVGKDYYGTCEELREFLEQDDLKAKLELNKEYDINVISKKFTREEFLYLIIDSDWCISKYGFSDDFEHCSIKMGGNCNWCFKDAIKDIKFKGED